MLETWRDIKEYEGYYQISNLGNVKSLARSFKRINGRDLPTKERILKQKTERTGYKVVVLNKNGKRTFKKVHRLVAQEFIENNNNFPQVNHKNGQKAINHVSNLEWITAKENQRHRNVVLRKHGTKPNIPKGVSWKKRDGLWRARITVSYKEIHIGTYSKKSEAYKAYFEKFIEIHGYEPWNLKIHKTH